MKKTMLLALVISVMVTCAHAQQSQVVDLSARESHSLIEADRFAELAKNVARESTQDMAEMLQPKVTTSMIEDVIGKPELGQDGNQTKTEDTSPSTTNQTTADGTNASISSNNAQSEDHTNETDANAPSTSPVVDTTRKESSGNRTRVEKRVAKEKEEEMQKNLKYQRSKNAAEKQADERHQKTAAAESGRTESDEADDDNDENDEADDSDDPSSGSDDPVTTECANGIVKRRARENYVLIKPSINSTTQEVPLMELGKCVRAKRPFKTHGKFTFERHGVFQERVLNGWFPGVYTMTLQSKMIANRGARGTVSYSAPRLSACVKLGEIRKIQPWLVMKKPLMCMKATNHKKPGIVIRGKLVAYHDLVFDGRIILRPAAIIFRALQQKFKCHFLGVFGFCVGNLKLGFRVVYGRVPPTVVLAGSIAVGKDCQKTMGMDLGLGQCMRGTMHLAIDTRRAEKSFVVADITKHVTLTHLLQWFSNGELQSEVHRYARFLQSTSFPEGLTASFSLSKTRAIAEGIIPGSIAFYGKINVMDYGGTFALAIESTRPVGAEVGRFGKFGTFNRFLAEVSFDHPISLGGVMTMLRGPPSSASDSTWNQNDDQQGPKIKIEAVLSGARKRNVKQINRVRIDVEGYTYLLGFGVYVRMRVKQQRLDFVVEGPMGFCTARVYVRAFFRLNGLPSLKKGFFTFMAMLHPQALNDNLVEKVKWELTKVLTDKGNSKRRQERVLREAGVDSQDSGQDPVARTATEKPQGDGSQEPVAGAELETTPATRDSEPDEVAGKVEDTAAVAEKDYEAEKAIDMIIRKMVKLPGEDAGFKFCGAAFNGRVQQAALEHTKLQVQVLIRGHRIELPELDMYFNDTLRTARVWGKALLNTLQQNHGMLSSAGTQRCNVDYPPITVPDRKQIPFEGPLPSFQAVRHEQMHTILGPQPTRSEMDDEMLRPSPSPAPEDDEDEGAVWLAATTRRVVDNLISKGKPDKVIQHQKKLAEEPPMADNRTVPVMQQAVVNGLFVTLDRTDRAYRNIIKQEKKPPNPQSDNTTREIIEAYETDWTADMDTLAAAAEAVIPAEQLQVLSQLQKRKAKVEVQKGRLHIERIQKKKVLGMEKVAKLLTLEAEKAALIANSTMSIELHNKPKDKGHWRTHWDGNDKEGQKELPAYKNSFERRHKKVDHEDVAAKQDEAMKAFVAELIADDEKRDVELYSTGNDQNRAAPILVDAEFVKTRRRRRRATKQDAELSSFNATNNGAEFANITQSMSTRRRRRRSGSGGVTDLPYNDTTYRGLNKLTAAELNSERIVTNLFKHQFNMVEEDVYSGQATDALGSLFDSADELFDTSNVATGGYSRAIKAVRLEIAELTVSDENKQKLPDDEVVDTKEKLLAKLNQTAQNNSATTVEDQVEETVVESSACRKDGISFGDWKQPWKGDDKLSCSCFKDRLEHRSSWFQMFMALSNKPKRKIYPCMATAYMHHRNISMSQGSCGADLDQVSGISGGGMRGNAKLLSDKVSQILQSIEQVDDEIESFGGQCELRLRGLLAVRSFYKHFASLLSVSPVSSATANAQNILATIEKAKVSSIKSNLQKFERFVSTVVSPLKTIHAFASEVKKLINVVLKTAPSQEKDEIDERIKSSKLLAVFESLQNQTEWAVRIVRLPVVQKLKDNLQKCMDFGKSLHVARAEKSITEFKEFAMSENVKVLGQQLTLRQILRMTSEALNALNDEVTATVAKAIKPKVDSIIEAFSDDIQPIFEDTMHKIPHFDIPNSYQMRNFPLNVATLTRDSIGVNPLSLYKSCVRHKNWVMESASNLCNCCIAGMVELDTNNMMTRFPEALPLVLVRSKLCRAFLGSSQMSPLPTQDFIVEQRKLAMKEANKVQKEVKTNGDTEKQDAPVPDMAPDADTNATSGSGNETMMSPQGNQSEANASSASTGVESEMPSEDSQPPRNSSDTTQEDSNSTSNGRKSDMPSGDSKPPSNSSGRALENSNSSTTDTREGSKPSEMNNTSPRNSSDATKQNTTDLVELIIR